MEECFLSSKATLVKPNGGVFTSREIDIISCILNGGTAKAISTVLAISHHTVSTHIGKIRNDLNLSSQDKIIKFVESSNNYIQIRERYIDLLLFSKFREMLGEINALKISQKYGCVVHAKVEEIDKYILLDYLKLAKIKVDISHGSAEYAEDKFHIICYPTGMNLENLNSDNVVASENHNNNIIDLTGQCIESNGSGTQYKSYFSLFGCISKIYSSETIDDILNEFKEYYFKIKDKKFHTDPEQNHMEVTDKRKTKYAIFVMLFFIALLCIPITIYWYSETHKTHLTNINVGEDIFLKRKDLTSKMDEILKKQKGVKFLVLVGQGGVGKTTIARYYINKNNAKIKWEINAVTEENTIKSLLELAIELSKTNSKRREEQKYIQAIEDPEIKKKSIISFVFSQLKEIKDWMLLFDNVDGFKMIYGFILPNKGLCNEGTIIITTRNANGSNTSFISDESVLYIEYLEKNEMKKLFCDILYGKKEPSKVEEIDKFLENIPPMPLDVSNAAYYIVNTNGSFEKYLEILKFPNEETNKLHSKFLDEGTEYNKTRYRMTVAVFDKLIEINPDFKELLLFICLLDSKNIPVKYLERCKKFAIVSDFLFNLKRFFSIAIDNDRFSIHKSIQEIGLIHLVGLLTNDEKEVFLKKIIHIMTPYSSIFWEKYKTYPRKMNKNDLNELEVHIKSMINSLKAFGLSISEENKYITKLLLAIGFIYGEDNFSQAKYFLNETLKYNENNGYIDNYEYALLLLALGYAYFGLEEFDDAKLWLNKGLEFCQNLIGAEILKAYGLCDLGRCYASTNEFNRAIALLEKALNTVDDNQENWAHETASQICLGLSNTYADHYINKNEGYKAVTYAQKSLKKLGLKSPLDNKIEDIKESVDSAEDRYWCLMKAYNRVGEYDNAQKCADYYYRLYEKYFKNDHCVFDKARVDIEYGYTLLRKGKLDFSLDILNGVINKKQELNDNNCLFHAIVGRTEAFVRLNKLDEAYSDFQYAISQKGNSTDNYTRLLFCISLYHAFIIKYKQKDYKLAFEHFSDFCSAIKDFCKGFLSTSAYNELLRANVFEIITDKSQIKAGLQNTIEIFSSVYGKDHPFVKEYVVENSN
ncbi:hypothetical protein FACS1894122_08340 [Alphaproteobacteria bacterium]|nr:hypothetical protein FACS1894122_08340 [Alphaproteobacteria bacterium]